MDAARASSSEEQERALAAALARLESIAPDADEWVIRLPGTRDPELTVFWRRAHGDPKRGSELLNAATGDPVRPRATFGGRLFYSFHYTFMLPGRGYWLAGVAAMFMLVALVSGVVAHRKIFTDFFTFRREAAPRRAWLDVHNVTSVVALPFHFMIVYTGLITLAQPYMPRIIDTVYADGARTFYREAFVGMPEAAERGVIEVVPHGELSRRAREVSTAGRWITDVAIDRPGRDDAAAQLHHAPRSDLLWPFSRNVAAMANTHDVLYDLHLARFADWTMRWLFFASGLAGSVMIAAGLICWTLKRGARDAGSAGARAGLYIAERLNVVALAGVLMATAAFFWANRLLPVGLEARGGWEIRCFFIVWAAAGVHAFLRPTMRAWFEQLAAVAVLFALLPLVSGLGTGRHLLSSVVAGDWTFVAFDLAALVTALSGAYAARRVRRAGLQPLTASAAGRPMLRDSELAA